MRTAHLVEELGPHTRASRVLMAGAAGWLTSGLFHLGVWVATIAGWDGPVSASWSGAVSWRKPIVFSMSIAALLWAFGWVLDRLPPTPRLAGRLAWTFLIASTVETGLIVAQTWRGRASHFNTATTADAVIFGLMGATVGVMSLALVFLFGWLLVRRPADGATRLAAIAGMAMIVTGLGIGQWIIDLGNAHVDRVGQVPSTVINGEAGVAKFPHAVAFHGIQVFAVLGALMRRTTWTAPRRRRLMRIAVTSYTGVLVFSAIQSFGGRAPLDLEIWSGALLVGSATVLAGLAALVGRSWWRTTADATPEPVSLTT